MTRPLTMPGQVTRIAPVGSLLKKPREQRVRKQAFRSGRETDAKYLDLIRQLPCLKCGLEDQSEPAHVRMNSAAFGKRQAIGQKPDDRWTTPLCASCHRTDDDSQHKMGEQQFWDSLGLNPLLICADLQRVAPDLLAMRAVVFRHIEQR